MTGPRVVVSLDGEILSELPLSRPVTVVGRHPECDIVIEHRAVSARHMLFRMVNGTVHAEDLASTNGTRVNGLAASHHVVRHLDLIEIGRHQLHFVDDARLAGALGDLENTVVNRYEQAMPAGDVAEARRAPVVRKAELDPTMAITRPPVPQLAAAQATATATVAQADMNGKAALALRVLTGPGEGTTVALDHPNTMIGRVGRDAALVIRRGRSFFIARLAGQRPLRLNRADLAPGTHPIREGDVIDVGVNTFEVIVAR